MSAAHVDRPRIRPEARWGFAARRAAVVAAAFLSLFLTFADGSADALVTHPYLFSFPSGAVSTGNFGGIAVDQLTGNVYVGDSQAQEVRQFDSSGDPADFSALGTDAIPGVSARAIAVDPSNGDLYVAATDNSIERFDPAGSPADFTAGPAAGTNVLTGADAPNGGLGFVAGLSVDSSGILYVSQNYSPAVIDKFSSTGEYAGLEISGASIQFPGALAVDSTGAIYDVENQTRNVVKFSPTGALDSTIDTGGHATGGIAVDPSTDTLFVGYSTGFAEFSSSGVMEGEFGSGEVKAGEAIAVNSGTVPDPADGRLYIQDSGRKAVDVFGPEVLVPDLSTGSATSTSGGVTLTGTVNSAGTAPADVLISCRFEYVTQAAFEANSASGGGFSDLGSGGSVPCETSDGNPISGPGEIPDDGADHEVTAAIPGLATNRDFRFRLVAENSNGPNYGAGLPFRTAGPPVVEALHATGVTADSADLGAQITPNTLETTYRFEYGLEACSAPLIPCMAAPLGGGQVGSGGTAEGVRQHVSGLQANTTYHYRVVAQNSLGTTDSPDHEFKTQLSGIGFQLSDSRAWELVSPRSKSGGALTVGALQTGITQAAADGDGLAYMTMGSIEVAPEGNRAIEPSSVLARRGASGWQSKDLTPPHREVTPFGLGYGDEYKIFSPDLSKALLDARDATPLSPQASERTPYLRENSEPPTYTPLLTSKEGYANVPPGTDFGGSSLETRSGIRIAGVNPGLSEVVLKSEYVPLVAGAPIGSLYAWRAGQLRPVSVLPSTEGGGFAGKEVQLGSALGSVHKAISDDGSRVFWSLGGSGVSGYSFQALYVYDTESQVTARLDVVEPGATGAGTAAPVFQGASGDGTTVFFTDTQQLTKDASPNGRDLYRCEVPPGPAPSGCASLTDISSPILGSGESTEVENLVSGISDDGASLYFVAQGILDTRPNQQGASAVSGQPNLYFWQEGQSPRFVATLSNEDSPDWGGPAGFGERLSASSSPDGRYLSFMSERSLTGYENRDALSNELDEEIFRYDALSERLICISCNPSGASPAGRLDKEPSLGTPLAVDLRSTWQGRWVAAILPSPTILATNEASVYTPRYTLDDGRVFFNAIDSLAPADSNGNWDVYQYESDGTGSCSEASGGAAVSRTASGCVSLISSGTGKEEAAFLDASTSGDDVFFLTSAQLSVLDEDSVSDIYDARVNGTAATLSPITECLGEACQAPAVPPNDPTPASLSFQGAGNERPAKRGNQRCPKGKHRVRGKGKARCVRGKHKMHHKHKQHRRHGGTNGKASR